MKIVFSSCWFLQPSQFNLWYRVWILHCRNMSCYVRWPKVSKDLLEAFFQSVIVVWPVFPQETLAKNLKQIHKDMLYFYRYEYHWASGSKSKKPRAVSAPEVRTASFSILFHSYTASYLRGSHVAEKRPIAYSK
jgi:hypothetical protein